MGMGMGIDQWEWEGMGILIVFPHTSSVYGAELLSPNQVKQPCQPRIRFSLLASLIGRQQQVLHCYCTQ